MSPNRTNRFLTGEDFPPAATELAETFPKIPALVVQFTRCGRARCHCQIGKPHGPYYYLRWREGPAQRRRYVRAADVPAVRAILEKRREHRRVERLAHDLSLCSWRELARLVEDYEARIHEQQERL